MRRTEQLQGLRLMKFEDVYGRCYGGDLSQVEASEILGVSERTFRRWRDRYEAEGAEGLYDRRLGRVSARRAAVDTVARVLERFETRYRDFTAKHFHEKLVAEHGFGLSYNWLRLTLQAHGRVAGTLEDILCVQQERIVAGDNTLRYKGRTLQIPADRHRHHYVKARVRVHEYPDGTLAVFHGPRRLACYTAQGEPVDEPDKRAA